MSHLEAQLLAQIRDAGLPEPVPQYRFAAHATGGPGRGVRARLAAAALRDWKFDFAWPEQRVAAECDGGTWTRGRHTRGAGYEEDCYKRNAATLRGWRVFNFTAGMLDADEAVPVIGEALQNE